ncbi:MAG: response regulator [Chloroflexi bacterium]|nr:MAG: response regulator [Chloroflexota bacterium]
MYPKDKRTIQILLVEDNPGDVRLTQETFREVKLPTHLHVVSDGVAALSFLHRQAPYQDAPRPDIILLDLNLPRKDGREVLAEIKQDPSLKRIPVLVLTTSKAEEDIIHSYNLHANCYISKPVDLNDFIHTIQTMNSFWLSIATLPPAF